MTLLPGYKIDIKTLHPKPGIVIWYSSIQQIIELIINKARYQNLGPDFKLDFKTRINETFQTDDFTELLFSNEEIKTINSFKALKKQIEWIGGRYLIKKMIQENFYPNSYPAQITLSYLEQGAPFVTNHPDIPVSLSHSNDYTTCAYCKDKTQIIGIDIEKITKKPDSWFLKTAFTQKEISHLQDDAAQIFKNWTIKEAYLKYIKKGFNENLHKVEVINNEIWHNNKKMGVKVYSTFIDDGYALSLVDGIKNISH